MGIRPFHLVLLIFRRSSAHVLKERHQERENAEHGEWTEANQGEPPQRLRLRHGNGGGGRGTRLRCGGD